MNQQFWVFFAATTNVGFTVTVHDTNTGHSKTYQNKDETIIDGCSLGGHFWVFFAATTNVGFTVTVTDIVTGHQAIYRNADKTVALPVQDTNALTCP